MHVSAEDALDLGMPLDQPAHGLCPFEAYHIHVLDVGAERRVMHEEDGGAVGLGIERPLEPGEASLAKLAASPARHQRVEADQPHGMILDRVLNELTRLRQVFAVAE